MYMLLHHFKKSTVGFWPSSFTLFSGFVFFLNTVYNLFSVYYTPKARLAALNKRKDQNPVPPLKLAKRLGPFSPYYIIFVDQDCGLL